MKTDNRTLFGINSEAERCIWIIWSLIVILAALTGDSLILIGTIRYRAIRQHKLIVAVMQHMAICDILVTVFKVLPTTMSLIADRWILGEGLCHANDNIGWVGAGVTLFLTCTFTSVKLLIVRFPLRVGTCTSIRHKACAGVWFLVLCMYIPQLVVRGYNWDTTYFSYRTYSCSYAIIRAPKWLDWYRVVSLTVHTFIPYTTLLLTSILLLIAAKRSASERGAGLQRKGVITVLLTVGVLMISYLPALVVLVVEAVGVQQRPSIRRVVEYLPYLNLMANFFIYSLTVRSFNAFLRMKISLLVSLLTPKSQRQTALQQRRPLQQQRPLQEQRPLQQRTPPQKQRSPARSRSFLTTRKPTTLRSSSTSRIPTRSRSSSTARILRRSNSCLTTRNPRSSRSFSTSIKSLQQQD